MTKINLIPAYLKKSGPTIKLEQRCENIFQEQLDSTKGKTIVDICMTYIILTFSGTCSSENNYQPIQKQSLCCEILAS